MTEKNVVEISTKIFTKIDHGKSEEKGVWGKTNNSISNHNP